MAIFNSYVSLPEGIPNIIAGQYCGAKTREAPPKRSKKCVSVAAFAASAFAFKWRTP